jgi:hypothetical protein
MRHAAGPTILAALSLLAASCAGYRIGDVKPAHLAQIRSIHVPVFRNATLEPRVASLATNETIAAFHRDSTYRITDRAQADAVLEAKIDKIEYIQLIPDRIDVLRPFELRNTISIKWFLKDAHTPNKVLDQGVAVGTSNLFVNSNVQTSRTNALPDAVRNAARAIVSHLADGF